MIDHSNGLTAWAQHQHEEIVRLVGSTSDREYAAPCEDHSGTTVAQVGAHCAEGYEQVAVWLQRLIDGTSPSTAPADLQAHPHLHPPPDQGAPLGQADLVSRLRTGGEVVIGRLRVLTEEQLNVVPPASPMADGTSRLETVLGGLVGHLQQHLEHMQAAVSRERSG